MSTDAVSLGVLAITIMALELGVLSIEQKDTAQGALLRAWLAQQFLPEFAERTLPVDIAVALRCAKLHLPNKRSERDALIAATALVHGMTVVTRNVADFLRSGCGHSESVGGDGAWWPVNGIEESGRSFTNNRRSARYRR